MKRGAQSCSLLAAIAAVWFSSCADSQALDENALEIGALLPFTGEQGTSGDNVERALLLAAENVNAAGGVAGVHLRIWALDTHSNLTRGLTAAEQLFRRPRLLAIAGPDDGYWPSSSYPRLTAPIQSW